MTHSTHRLCTVARNATLGFAVAGAASLFSAQALAAPPVKGLTMGLERTFGFVAASRSYENDPADVTNSSIGFSLGLASNFNALPLYNRPRLSADYILDNAISFGGAIGFAYGTYSTESQIGNGSVTVNQPDTTMFLIAPRGGYLIGITDHFGIWPRAGFTFVGVGLDDDDDEDDDDLGASAFALSVDVPILYAIGPMGAFVAPSLDLGVGGSIDTGPEEFDARATEFGITFGFFGVF